MQVYYKAATYSLMLQIIALFLNQQVRIAAGCMRYSTRILSTTMLDVLWLAV
jgi:hypothetical protein